MQPSKILAEIVLERVASLHSAWQLTNGASQLERKFEFSGYPKAVYLTNLCIWLSEKTKHHADISFGWGYVIVRLTTHDVEGLSELDFDWAQRLDKLLED